VVSLLKIDCASKAVSQWPQAPDVSVSPGSRWTVYLVDVVPVQSNPDRTRTGSILAPLIH
jgi:hypothetical protein